MGASSVCVGGVGVCAFRACVLACLRARARRRRRVRVSCRKRRRSGGPAKKKRTNKAEVGPCPCEERAAVLLLTAVPQGELQKLTNVLRLVTWLLMMGALCCCMEPMSIFGQYAALFHQQADSNAHAWAPILASPLIHPCLRAHGLFAPLAASRTHSLRAPWCATTGPGPCNAQRTLHDESQ